MTYHQCPKCELRFTWQTELDAHCRDDHPHFRHDYPAKRVETTAQVDTPARTGTQHSNRAR